MFFVQQGVARVPPALEYALRRTKSGVSSTPEDTVATEDLSFKQDELPEDRSLVIVDDDRAFLQRLARAMELRGFEVRFGHSVAEGVDLIREKAPAFAVVDMRLEDGSGLDVIAELAKVRADARAIVLTGYGNIATAVSAVKLGAVDYLAKPADADDVTDALLAPSDSKAPPPDNPMSADRVRWEHIQRVYELCNRNVSETARRLNMHRRTLQRILAKRAPK
jgi:two-component system response regulator RegA